MGGEGLAGTNASSSHDSAVSKCSKILRIPTKYRARPPKVLFSHVQPRPRDLPVGPDRDHSHEPTVANRPRRQVPGPLGSEGAGGVRRAAGPDVNGASSRERTFLPSF